MANQSTDPQPVTVVNVPAPVTNPNTANASLGGFSRVNFGQPARIPNKPTPITPVRRK